MKRGSKVVYLDFNLSDVKRELAERSLAEFAKQAWSVVEPANPFVGNWHIDAICDHLEAIERGEIRNLLINIPPRHMKSLLVAVFWPAWAWIKNPELRWLFASYARDLSRNDSLRCRRVLQSPWYQANWGHLFQLTGDQNEKLRFENDRTGCRVATSVEGTGTGEGGDRIVCDDPHKVTEVESRANREAVLKWWDEEMSTRGNNPQTVAKVLVMQRVHERDLSGHILEQGGYTHLCLPAEYEPRVYFSPSGWTDPRHHAGDLLWPDRFPKDHLAEQRLRLGSRAYAGQFQQRPSPVEGNIVKRSWWKTYSIRPTTFDCLLISLDSTFHGGKNSDFVTAQVWGRLGARKYLLDQIRGKWSFTETLQEILALIERWPDYNELVVEKAANGAAIIDSLQTRVRGIIPWTPKGDKESRAQAISPQVEAGNVYIPDPSTLSWVSDFVEEWVLFPAGRNDDQVDATTMALLRMESHAVEWWKPGPDFPEGERKTKRLAEIFWPDLH